MKDVAVERAIVFTRTKHGADKVAQHLEKAGVGAQAIHGNKSQNQRVRALDGFKRGTTRVLVATDIAARGIDVDGVTHVVNFELPDVPEAYVHRIGRTARAGASGQAISLCDNEERGLLRQIEKLTRQSMPSMDRRNPNAPRVEATAERPRFGAGLGPAFRGREAARAGLAQRQSRSLDWRLPAARRAAVRPGLIARSGATSSGAYGAPGSPRPYQARHAARRARLL